MNGKRWIITQNFVSDRIFMLTVSFNKDDSNKDISVVIDDYNAPIDLAKELHLLADQIVTQLAKK